MADPFISEVRYRGNASVDFIEIAVDAGTDVSGFALTIYRSNGTIRSTNLLGTPVATIAGRDIYVVDNSTGTFNGLGRTNAFALSNNGTVVQNNGTDLFFNFDDGGPVSPAVGPAAGLTSTGIGQTAAGESLESQPNDPNNFSVQTAPNSGTIVCFAPGALIETSNGPCPVERIKPGDLVRTLDSGFAPVRWAGARIAPGHGDDTPHRIRCGDRWLELSPNHRVLASGFEIAKLFGEREVLVAVKHLAGGGVVRRIPRRRVAYFHILFDEHHLISAEGVWVESLFTGDYLLKKFPPAMLSAIRTQSGWRASDARWRAPAARPILKGYEAKLIANSWRPVRAGERKGGARAIAG